MREDSAIKMVVEWGGIRRGSVDELKIMANETPEQLINRGFHRVASWSKVLVLHDPEKYLIYDARVAFATNLILYNSGSIETFFPMPPSRNTHIVRASNSQIGIKLKLGKSKKIDGGDFYTSYLRMAKTVAEKMGCPAWQIEMALFARWPELAKLAI